MCDPTLGRQRPCVPAQDRRAVPAVAPRRLIFTLDITTSPNRFPMPTAMPKQLRRWPLQAWILP